MRGDKFHFKKREEEDKKYRSTAASCSSRPIKSSQQQRSSKRRGCAGGRNLQEVDSKGGVKVPDAGSGIGGAKVCPRKGGFEKP